MEEFDAPVFLYLFDSEHIDDLEMIAELFARVFHEPLTDHQKDRILAFWDRCISWTEEQITPPPPRLMSKLSLLACYVKTLGTHETALLQAVVPYVSTEYNADKFIEELDRFVNVSPTETCKVLGVISEMLTGTEADPASLPWWNIQYQHTQAIRSLLMERYSPASTNKMLAALRGVLRG